MTNRPRGSCDRIKVLVTGRNFEISHGYPVFLCPSVNRYTEKKIPFFDFVFEFKHSIYNILPPCQNKCPELNTNLH